MVMRPNVIAVLLLFIASLPQALGQGSNPRITSISQVWARGYFQDIQISGSGFGALKAYTGDSPFIVVTDVTQGWEAGHSGDAVTLSVTSWTDTLISVNGFGGAYGTGNQNVLVGDVLSFKVWNAQTGAGPAKGQSAGALANATEIYNFLRGSDSAFPKGGVVLDSAGNIYGTASQGGINVGSCLDSSCGTVYELTKGTGSIWTETLLYQFQAPPDGSYPMGSLVRDSAGNLYGAAFYGGINCGTVFKISGSTETILHTFQGGSDGCSPQAGLTMDSSGNLYGTTSGLYSSNNGAGGSGSVYELSPDGNGGFNYSVIYLFKSGDFDGSAPVSSLTLDSSGNLYGTTSAGGGTLPRCDSKFPQSSCGTVFELSPVAGGGWNEKVIHTFHGTAEGFSPFTGVTFDDAGNLYGTTQTGGPLTNNCPRAGCGVVYALSPRGDGTWEEKTLINFQGGADAYFPVSNLTYYRGLFYGFTDDQSYDVATIYKLTPLGKGQWSEAVVYRFGLVTDGGFQVGTPFIASDGTIYGASTYGGATFGGVVFSLP
jgi:uncharacterized repeat protein (TIGR03803 family)